MVLAGVAVIGVGTLACTASPTASGPGTTIGATGRTPGGGSEVAGGPGPLPIPTRTAPPTTAAPVVTTPDGAPALVEYHAPTTFTCMTGTPDQAQITLGWNAPSATEVSFTLDGAPLAKGIQNPIPYEVPAGGPAQVGATIVFACEPASTHTITATWRMHDSPPTERVITITKEPAR